MNKVQTIIDKFKEADNKIIDESMQKVIDLAYYATNAYSHPNYPSFQSALKVKLYSILALDIKYPNYYVFDDKELVDDYDLNLTLEKYYNVYNILLTSTCKSIIAFANAVSENLPNVEECYEKYLLGTKSLEAFNKWDMVIGLLNHNSYETYLKDVSLMDLVCGYLNTGTINYSKVLFDLKDYRGLWPANKMSIYEQIKEISYSQIKHEK